MIVASLNFVNFCNSFFVATKHITYLKPYLCSFWLEMCSWDNALFVHYRIWTFLNFVELSQSWTTSLSCSNELDQNPTRQLCKVLKIIWTNLFDNSLNKFISNLNHMMKLTILRFCTFVNDCSQSFKFLIV